MIRAHGGVFGWMQEEGDFLPGLIGSGTGRLEERKVV